MGVPGHPVCPKKNKTLEDWISTDFAEIWTNPTPKSCALNRGFVHVVKQRFSETKTSEALYMPLSEARRRVLMQQLSG
jgi:hypothetical protein